MKSYRILAGSQITREMILEAVRLDRISYKDVYQLQPETCYSYFERNRDIYIMAVENESSRVIGYLNFSPIKESVFAELLSGNAIDTVIGGDDVLPYRDGGSYWGYFSSVVVHPDYRRRGIATQMLFHWSDLIFRLAAERNIFFRKIVADAVSEAGSHLLSEIGFSFVRASAHESRIMTLDLFRACEASSKFKEKLPAIYRIYHEKGGTGHAV